MKHTALSGSESEALLITFQKRFEKNMTRHQNISWTDVEAKLLKQPDKLWSLSEMERTGGEPDVVAYNESVDEYSFFDCSAESPAGRRSLCYDPEALDARKENKPSGSAIGLAAEIGIELLNEEQYRSLQQLGKFDLKTSSWIQTPPAIRKLGGALFADFRYGNVFVYHNGVQSYYAARAFRGCLKV
jgi:hypothetical protein